MAWEAWEWNPGQSRAESLALEVPTGGTCAGQTRLVVSAACAASAAEGSVAQLGEGRAAPRRELLRCGREGTK